MATDQKPTGEQDQQSTQDPASCDSQCSSCGTEGCPSRTGAPVDPHFKLQADSTIKHIIAVVSGKGGVGKSLVTSLLTESLIRRGNKVGLLDADVTGPSQPRAFGLHEHLRANQAGIVPGMASNGLAIVSTNLILDQENSPVIWRGGMISNMVHEFFSEVVWGELDYLIVDMPPGTGDVPLTVFQSFPIDGVVCVTAPQDLVSMIVGKAIKMAETMQVPVLGLVENMSGYICPDCGKRHDIFGPSRLGELAQEFSIDLTCALPIMPELAGKMDNGTIAEAELPDMEAFVDGLLKKVEK
jgi:Mrp family chromosome partitioning ATPase